METKGNIDNRITKQLNVEAINPIKKGQAGVSFICMGSWNRRKNKCSLESWLKFKLKILKGKGYSGQRYWVQEVRPNHFGRYANYTRAEQKIGWATIKEGVVP
jgi:hypothetical protein